MWQNRPLRKDCRQNRDRNVFATIKTNERYSDIDCYMITFVDSASSCHTVTPLQFLDKGTIQTTEKCVKVVDGTLVQLTHKGKRKISTRQGIIRLNDVYYADELQFNLSMCQPLTIYRGLHQHELDQEIHSVGAG